MAFKKITKRYVQHHVPSGNSSVMEADFDTEEDFHNMLYIWSRLGSGFWLYYPEDNRGFKGQTEVTNTKVISTNVPRPDLKSAHGLYLKIRELLITQTPEEILEKLNS